jgi:hypothetical protein
MSDELPQSILMRQYGDVRYLHHSVAAILERAPSKSILALVVFVEFIADGPEMLENCLTAIFSRLVRAPDRARYRESA